MWKRDENLLKIVLEMDFVWNVAQKLLIQNAQNVTILKNNFFVRLNTEKSGWFLMVLRYPTLTISSTFPQSHSKMSLLVNKVGINDE